MSNKDLAVCCFFVYSSNIFDCITNFILHTSLYIWMLLLTKGQGHRIEFYTFITFALKFAFKR